MALSCFKLAMGSVRSEAAGGGYPSALLSRSHTLGSSHWLTDAAWLGGLMVAAGAAWRGLAAHHPAVRLLATGYLAVEGLFYLWSKLRCVLEGSCDGRKTRRFLCFQQSRPQCAAAAPAGLASHSCPALPYVA